MIMTKKEFAQRVAIALCGNPKFVDHMNFSYCDIVDKADALADTFEARSNYGRFDEVSDAEVIADKLEDIEVEMEREFDIENNIE